MFQTTNQSIIFRERSHIPPTSHLVKRNIIPLKSAPKYNGDFCDVIVPRSRGYLYGHWNLLFETSARNHRHFVPGMDPGLVFWGVNSAKTGSIRCSSMGLFQMECQLQLQESYNIPLEDTPSQLVTMKGFPL